jgi:hypothetical protein
MDIRGSLPLFREAALHLGGSRKRSPESSQNLGDLFKKGCPPEGIQRKCGKENLQILPGKQIPREKKMGIPCIRILEKELSLQKRYGIPLKTHLPPEEKRQSLGRAQSGGGLRKQEQIIPLKLPKKPGKGVATRVQLQRSLLKIHSSGKVLQGKLFGSGGHGQSGIKIQGPPLDLQILQERPLSKEILQRKGDIQTRRPKKGAVIPGEKYLLQNISPKGIALGPLHRKSQIVRGPEEVHPPHKKSPAEGEVGTPQYKDSSEEKKKEEKSYEKSK